MHKKECFQLGHITRTHGLQGALVAFFDTDRPGAYQKLESVFVDIRGELVPFFISRLEPAARGHFILEFEDLPAAEADTMINRELWLPLDALPPLRGKNFYYHEVIGFAAEDRQEGFLGHCAEVIDRSAQPLFRILEGETEILVPATDAFIEAIDRKQRVIRLQCPPGLIELYRGSEE